jgi:putative PIN family toxin of toxin-antitoxin system
VRTVTLDTNIYISALAFHGHARLLIQSLVEDPDVRIAISNAILQETLRVLREKFKWPEEELRDAEALILESTYRIAPTQVVDVVRDDASDNRIVECAVESDSECIVSGDKHLHLDSDLTLGPVPKSHRRKRRSGFHRARVAADSRRLPERFSRSVRVSCNNDLM